MRTTRAPFAAGKQMLRLTASLACLGFWTVGGSIPSARAGSADPPGRASIHPGAIEVGIAGASTTVEGSTRADVAVRGGTFVGAGQGLAGGEIEITYAHVSSLDVVDLEAGLSWQRAFGVLPLYAFLSAGGGVRQERLGSFRQARYPLGFSLGLRALALDRAGARIEYRYRRILDDPVADFTEQQVRVGLSLYFRNASP